MHVSHRDGTPHSPLVAPDVQQVACSGALGHHREARNGSGNSADEPFDASTCDDDACGRYGRSRLRSSGFIDSSLLMRKNL